MDALGEGLLLLAKPRGPTSHDMVAAVRRATGQRRVGHAGTLDPMAEGLLPLVLGPATRLVRFLPRSPKCYSGTLELGKSSDTDDATGEVRTHEPLRLPDAAAVVVAAREMQGRGLQRPPAFSARKVEGQRLYRMARKGLAAEARPTEIEVYRFELSPTARQEIYDFEAEVTGGTYIRALARDLGEKLGCGGILTSLLRTAIGPMRLGDALELPSSSDPEPQRILEALIPPDRMPLEPPAFRLDDSEEARRFALGAALPVERSDLPEGLVRVLHPSGRLLGMAEARDGRLQPRIVLRREGRRRPAGEPA